jgi:hypothetical protein
LIPQEQFVAIANDIWAAMPLIGSNVHRDPPRFGRAWPGTSSVADRIQWPFFGFRVKMQPQTTIAIIAATKIPSCSCCIVVFSVA